MARKIQKRRKKALTLPVRHAIPLLKWAGGKAVFVREIAQHVPKLLKGARYYEPFAGAVSLFLAIKPRKARLSDLNEHLIEAYRSIRSAPDVVSKYLQSMARRHNKTFYYQTRASFNRSRSAIHQAARFIYLNKAGFNGVYRVNTQGKFNVPHGKRRILKVPSTQHLEQVARMLKKAQLRAVSFEIALRDARRGDFVYLDPPYPALNGSSFFAHYTKERFSEEEQRNVAAVARKLARNGVRVLVTNANTSLIRGLYAGWKIRKVSRPRWVRSGKVKHQVSELIITSY
jgi:DNA adenine methylase